MNVSVIGHSLQRRPIYSLSLGVGPISYLYNAAHHANEWITSVLLTRFAEDCVRQINQDAHVCNADTKRLTPKAKYPWYERITLHMVLMVNPDGVDMVTKGVVSDIWKANARGVDLNSNYPAGWEQARTHKYSRGYTSFGPRDFVGPFPLSEPESQAMVTYTKQIDPVVTLSLHTQGEEIYWRYADYMPHGARELAVCLSNASGYLLEEVPSESSHGGYRDWFIQEYNRPGFTIECGLGKNPLPISEFDNIYLKIAPLLMEALRYTVVSF